jgi:peptidoglycan-N-acetylglucosamine deacetylase
VDMGSYSAAQVTDQLSRNNQAIQNAGAPKPTVFRPPYGTVNNTVRQAASALGLVTITWDVDSQDWNGASTANIVAANGRLTNGQVILMHENQANSLAAIPQIAANLKSRGLCPGKLDPATGRAVKP